jgi:hypothetical protein
MNLHLNAAHPDQAGGLKFLTASIRGFSIIGFAFNAVIAGGMANRIINNGASIAAFQFTIPTLVALITLTFALPLLLFAPRLRSSQMRGMFEYGVLAGAAGRRFEDKWLANPNAVNANVLDVPDFSSTTDLYQTVSNVYATRYTPADLKTWRELLFMMALPFVPVIVTAVPLKEILHGVVKLVL